MQWTSEAYKSKELVSTPGNAFWQACLVFQYTDDQKLFINLANFDFESICISEEKFKNTEMTTCFGKHVPISVSISSNLIATPFPLQL